MVGNQIGCGTNMMLPSRSLKAVENGRLCFLRKSTISTLCSNANLFGLVLSIVVAGKADADSYTVSLLTSSLGFTSTDVRGGSNTSQVGQAGIATDSHAHAVLWDDEAAIVVDLNPMGFSDSFAIDVLNDHQVGWGSGLATGLRDHALLWNGTADSAVDLNPAGFASSVAYGVSETNQVGWAFSASGGDHAILWNGTANSAIDLHPADLIQTRAYDVNGTSQVGYGIGFAPEGSIHATLWHSGANTAVDLNPIGFDQSIAFGVDGAHQVGNGRVAANHNKTHALLWNGTAASAVDLNPTGYLFSNAEAVNGSVQVGFGNKSFEGPTDHALLWNGTASSVIDLHQFLFALGPNFTGSRAFGIAANGDIFGHAIDANGVYYAVKWSPVPEPATAIYGGLASMVLLSIKPRSKS